MSRELALRDALREAQVLYSYAVFVNFKAFAIVKLGAAKIEKISTFVPKSKLLK
jgi:hypothetical protein